MSSSTISNLETITKEIVTYMGMSIVVLGVLGNFLNILVFLSLRTFRESSCAFYLTVIPFVNIGQLILGQLSRVMITGFNINWTLTSLIYCKFRLLAIEVCTFTSFTCICLATIDQFLATCDRVYWQQWSNIKLARCLSVVSIIFWILYNIPYLIFYEEIPSSTTGKISCSGTNTIFEQYSLYVNNIILGGGLPVFISVLFGSLAFRNVRQIAYRTVPLGRRELDKQLTNMVLVQVVFIFFFATPYIILSIISSTMNINSDPVKAAQVSAATLIAACIDYIYFACPFYIYICVSQRFRQQLIYVLCQLHFNKWQREGNRQNQILPHPS